MLYSHFHYVRRVNAQKTIEREKKRHSRLFTDSKRTLVLCGVMRMLLLHAVEQICCGVWMMLFLWDDALIRFMILKNFVLFFLLVLLVFWTKKWEPTKTHCFLERFCAQLSMASRIDIFRFNWVCKTLRGKCIEEFETKICKISNDDYNTARVMSFIDIGRNWCKASSTSTSAHDAFE